MAEVQLHNVTKRFDDGTVAVNNVSFNMQDGQFLVIVGPSGCGKTTTLRMVAGLETITDGQISIGGRVVNDVHPKDRDIAMVFQNYALYPHMTVRQNMEFALKMRKIPRDEMERRVMKAAKMLELDELLARKPKALSGGQRQRVALGRAIVRDPKVFLFDEPLSNLDAKLRAQTRAQLQKLHHELKATSMYVTHDQVEAMTMADVIVVMNKANIQQVATPMELYNRPANKFVAGFIGTPSMNFFEGAVQAVADGSLVFVTSDSNPLTIPLGPVPDAVRGAVTLGVRPEHLVATTPSDPLGFSVHVDVVETLGHQTLAYFASAGALAVASVDPNAHVHYGDILRLRIAPERGYFFGADGVAISL